MINTVFVYDFEVFTHEYHAVFKSLDKSETFVLSVTNSSNNITQFKQFLDRVSTLIGWNNSAYDDHLLDSILNGNFKPSDINYLNSLVFDEGQKFFYKRDSILLNSSIKFIDSIQLPKDVGGLKASGGWRLNADMVECSVPFDTLHLTDEQRVEVLNYCNHDVDITIDIFLTDEFQSNLAVRQLIVDEHPNLAPIGFWTNDANLADWIIADSLENAKSFEQLKKAKNKVAYNKKNDSFLFSAKDVIPNYIEFTTPKNKQSLEEMLKVINQDALSFKVNYEFEINGEPYKFGIGGLHFCPKSGVFENVYEFDFDSFYPSLIRNLKIIPKDLNNSFCNFYSKSIDERLSLKKLISQTTDPIESAKYKVKSDSLKKMLNTVYGQLKTKGKYVYSPVDSLRVVFGGQLTMLMICEQLNLAGIQVIFGNTDGLFVDKDIPSEMITKWEQQFNLFFSKDQYTKLVLRDVNALCGIKVNGKRKSNGFFDAKKMAIPKIIGAGVAEYLLNGTNVEDYVRSITDLQPFQEIKKLNKNESPTDTLNKVNRYYRSLTGIKIPSGADNVTITNKLPTTLPIDINYQYYIDEINTNIAKVLEIKKPKKAKLDEFEKHKISLKSANIPFLVPKARVSRGKVSKSSINGWNNPEILNKYKDDITQDMMEGCCGLGFATGSLTNIITVDIDDFLTAKECGLFDLLKGGLITHHTTYSGKELKTGVANCSFSFLYEGSQLKTHGLINGYELFYNNSEGKPSRIVQATGPHQHKITQVITYYDYCGKLVPLPKKLEKFLLTNQPLSSTFTEPREDIVYEPVEPEKVNDLLYTLQQHEPELSYEDWVNVAFATAHSVGLDDANVLMHSYWPEKQHGEYEKLFNGWDYNKSKTILWLEKRVNTNINTIGEQITQITQVQPVIDYEEINFDNYPTLQIPIDCESERGQMMLSRVKEILNYIQYEVCGLNFSSKSRDCPQEKYERHMKFVKNVKEIVGEDNLYRFKQSKNKGVSRVTLTKRRRFK